MKASNEQVTAVFFILYTVNMVIQFKIDLEIDIL